MSIWRDAFPTNHTLFFKNIDLTGIKHISFNDASKNISATLEVHKGSLN